ncbi:MAG TPA: phosphate signaling complex protein PhoU [Myxococcaceae bacterium]|jgi:phosphate transport system protein
MSPASSGKVGASHTDKAFESDLRLVREKLLAMGAKVEEQIAKSMRSLTDRDSELGEQVKEADVEINRLEVDIDELCRKILALRQPAASDLRLITTALKIVTDLERIGDLAVNIAERAMDLNQAPPLAAYVDMPRLAELAQEQVKKALDSFVRADPDEAQEVLAGDDHLDDLFVKIFNELLAFMMEDSRNIRRATSLVSICKHLERIGDHAVNVAEMVIYMVRGTDVRHPRSRIVES